MADTASPLRSLLWSGLETVGTVLIGLLSVIVIARFIGPVDFGLAAIGLGLTLIFIVFISSLVHDGLVRSPDYTERQLDSAFTFSLLAGAAVAANGMLRGRPVSETLGAGVSLAVAAVPEGLPFVATVAQLGAARRLSKHNVLVRNPRAIEALGRVDVVCADKTGTLTEGRLHLRVVSNGVTEGTNGDLSPVLQDVLAAGTRATPEGEPEDLPHPTDRAVAIGAKISVSRMRPVLLGILRLLPGRRPGRHFSVRWRCRTWAEYKAEVEPKHQ